MSQNTAADPLRLVQEWNSGRFRFPLLRSVTTGTERPPYLSVCPSVYLSVYLSLFTYLFGEAIPSSIFMRTFELVYVSWLNGKMRTNK